jgi:FkbM family methyltransferase
MEDYSGENDVQALVEANPKGFDVTFLTSPRLKKFFEDRVFEQYTVEQFVSRLKDATTFIDIGAHHGFYSFLAAKIRPDLKIHAVEALPENVATIKATLARTPFANIALHEIAASDKEGEALFNRTIGSDTGSFVKHPLVKHTGQIKVATSQIDQLVKVTSKDRVLVKIDTDGHELAVLRGMQQMMRSVENLTLLVEFNPKCLRAGGNDPVALLKVLHEANFELYFLDDSACRHYRLTPEKFSQWSEYLEPHRYHNLLCLRPNKSLSATFFSQLSSLTGSERSMLELVRELVQEYGVLTNVVFPRDGELVQAVRATGASTIIEPYHTWYSASRVGTSTLRTWMQMSIPGFIKAHEQIRRIDPHVIASNVRFIPWGLLSAQLLNKPHVLFPREAKELAEMGEWLTGLPRANELFYNHSAAIMCASNEPVMQFQRRPKCKVYRTHIRIEEKDRRAKAPTVFSRPSSFKLFFPGNIYQDKGQQDAVAAVAQLIGKGRDIELTFLGQAYEPFASNLKKEVAAFGLEERIRFASFTNNPYPHFLQADAILVCSRGEAFGRVSAEAMTLGVPLITTDILGAEPLLETGDAALTYTPGDVPALVHCIERLISEPELGKKLTANAHKHLETFSVESYGGAVHTAFMQLKGKPAEPDQGLAALVLPWISTSYGYMQHQMAHQIRAGHVAVYHANNHIATLDSQIAALKKEKDLLQQKQNESMLKKTAAEQALQDITNTITWRTRSRIVTPGFSKKWRKLSKAFREK